MNKFKINGFIHQRTISNTQTEIALDVTPNNEELIPEDTSYFVFVLLQNAKATKVEEVALGSSVSISLLTDLQKAIIKQYVESNYTDEIMLIGA